MDNMKQHWVTPLAHQISAWTEAQDTSGNAGLHVHEWPQTGYIIVRGHGNDNAFTSAVGQALGVTWPSAARSSAKNDKVRVLWLSPDEWAVICAYDDKAQHLATLQQAVENVSAQVVDNSGGVTALVLSGTDVSTVLRHLTPYDVESLKVGDCVGTVVSQAHVLLHRGDDAQYEIIIRRSFADYVWKLLVKAARPYEMCAAL